MRRCLICGVPQTAPFTETRSFHRVPYREDRRNEWLKILGLTQVEKYSVICSNHFKADDFHGKPGEPVVRRFIKSNAVPCLEDSVTTISLPEQVDPSTVDLLPERLPIKMEIYAEPTTISDEIDCTYFIDVNSIDRTLHTKLERQRSIENMSSTDTGDEGPAVPDFNPPKKRVRKGHFDAKTKEMIVNVYKKEFFDNPDILLSAVATRVASKTGVSFRSVERIISEYKRNGALSEPKPKPKRQTAVDLLTEFDATAIRRKIHDFFFRKEIPTVEKVLTVVNEDPDLPSFKKTTFRKVLKQLNFVIAKRQRNRFLMDSNDIKCWRRDFLTKIKAFRNENRKIYYLDETWVNAGRTKSKVFIDKSVTSSRQTFVDGLSTELKNPSGKGPSLIVCHIGSEDGFVPGGLWTFRSNKNGDYHEEMDGPSFEKWFAKILSMLEENAVVVLDNAPYHSRMLEKIPTTASKKSDIQERLRSKDIDFEENMIKAQLLRLVNENKHLFNKYIVDEMAKKQNKIVLRLPTYHCELNPIEFIWADVENFVAVKNKTFKLADIENIFQDAIAKITPVKWKKYLQHVQQKVEVEMWKLDDILDEMEIEPLVIRLEENSTSPSENDST